MKMKYMAGGALALMALGAWAAKDPVIMTVNGIDVPLSEFEYLFHKNSQQQIDPQPLDSYVDIFKVYKLKVADALDKGIDTTAAFKAEMAQYRHELAAPYMADSVYINKLIDEAYGRMDEEVEVKIISRYKSRSHEENVRSRQLLDSLRRELKAGADFTEIADRYSQDANVKEVHGNLGFTQALNYPYTIETPAYELAEGDYSEVVESPVGYHIIKGGKHRPARGTVHVQHILKMVPQDADAATEARIRHEIDSIYGVLSHNPGQFESMAMNLSDDKGTARQGGLLQWFGAGEMVPEFDQAAFALDRDEISKPVRTRFGWHIIKKINERPVPTAAQARQRILKRITSPQDARSKMIADNLVKRLEKSHKGSICEATATAISTKAGELGLCKDFYDYYKAGTPEGDAVLATIDKRKITATDFAASLNGGQLPAGAETQERVAAFIPSFYAAKLRDAEEARLEKEEASFRNLYNEYYGGSLLYEASVREVWDKAAKDKEGLDAYFKAHRGDYAWNDPHVKGYLVQAENDSVAALARKRMETLPVDSLITGVRQDFGSKVRVEKVLVAKGGNPMVDNIIFGGPKVRPSVSNFTAYFLFNPRLISVPEEVDDVRGLVTSDYQNLLEQEWIEKLKARYPVKVNANVLKKVKDR